MVVSAKWSPSVGIRDPHCAGRPIDSKVVIPASLEAFADEAWATESRLSSPSDHYKYQEAVLVGDDLGMLHAFQLDSGNELSRFRRPMSDDHMKELDEPCVDPEFRRIQSLTSHRRIHELSRDRLDRDATEMVNLSRSEPTQIRSGAIALRCCL